MIGIKNVPMDRRLDMGDWEIRPPEEVEAEAEEGSVEG